MAVVKRIREGLIPFWMLCDASTVAEKIAFMRRCHAGGIRGLAMHPRAGNLIPFASTEWFGMIRELVAEAHRLDMSLWLYDEDPYPSGGAGGLVTAERPDLKSRSMKYHQKPEELKEGQLWFISEAPVIWAGLVPVKEPLPARPLTDTVGPIRADWFSGEWDSRYYYNETPLFPCVRGSAIRCFFTMRVPPVPAGYRLVAVAIEEEGGEGPWGSLPDLMHPDAFDAFRRHGLEPYRKIVGEHFGGTIPGIFSDEAKPFGVVPFTSELFDSFEQRYGYDLCPRLYQLFGEPVSDDYVRVRLDYRRWVAERFLSSFVKPYRQWCDENSLLLVGHFSPEDDPLLETWCIGAVMPVMKTMSVPGTDVIVPYLGDENAPTLNQGSLRAASIKSQTGCRYCSSESLACADWTATSQGGRHSYAWQKVLGVERFFTHGFWNTIDGVSNYEAPPDYGPNSSIFRGTAEVNRWLVACDELMDGATETADVAVLDSVASFWSWAPEMDEGHLVRLRRSVWRCILACLQAQVGAHMVDERELLAGAVVEGGALRVGERCYTSVLVPAADLLDEAVFLALCRAEAAGVSVTWFGGGPPCVVSPEFRLKRSPRIKGTVEAAPWPSRSWCLEHLPVQVGVGGRNAIRCYVRRFHAESGGEWLFAVNVTDVDQTFNLADDIPGGRWLPVEGMVDGDTVHRRGETKWRAAGCGTALFRLSKESADQEGRRLVRGREIGLSRTFRRLSPNVLRLDACKVARDGRGAVALPYPKPYWQVFDDYTAQQTLSQFIGDVPVESRVPCAHFSYVFAFRCADGLKAPRLVLDPRSVRGTFRLFVNGTAVGGARVFPLDHITPARILIRGLKKGRNTVELRFEGRHAMDGVLCPVFLEGVFDLSMSKSGASLVLPGDAISADGWQAMGLAHYMGDGRYEWTERLSADEARSAVGLELDKVVDSAELFVNGRSMGTRAWNPWRWALSGLRCGKNRFRLVVSSTAGNKLSLLWPGQAQGWIGQGFLLTEESAGA